MQWTRTASLCSPLTPTVRPVPQAMHVFRASAVALLLLTASCRPDVPERPPSVPLGAALIPSTDHPSSHVWASCTPTPESSRLFLCSFFEHPSGLRRPPRLFRLVQGDASGHPLPPPPRPPARAIPPTPAVPPSAIQLRSYDGVVLLAQPPWYLLPEGTPPYHADPSPPEAPPASERPA